MWLKTYFIIYMFLLKPQFNKNFLKTKNTSKFVINNVKDTNNVGRTMDLKG